MAVMAAAIFRSIFTVTENRRPPGGPHRRSRPSHPHHDRPGGKRGGAAGSSRPTAVAADSDRCSYVCQGAGWDLSGLQFRGCEV